MSSQALPNYTVPVPQVQSPIQSIGRLMQLKSGMADLALKQQQEKQAEQQTALIEAEQQQKNRDLADQNTIQELMKDPSIGPRIAAGDTGVLMGKVQPKTVTALDTTLAELHSKKATTAKADLENSNVALGRITQALSGLQTTFGEDLGKINEALPETIASLKSQKAFEYAGVDESKLPTAITDPKDLPRLAAHLGIAQALNDKALEIKGKQAEQASKEATTRQTLAQAANLEAQNPGIAAEAAGKVASLPVTQATAAATLADPNLLNPEQRQTEEYRKQELHQQLDKAIEDARHNRATERYQMLSVEGSQLDEPAKDKIAEMFAITGQMPSLGMGKAASLQRSEIINRAAKNFPNVDFATNKAAYQANTTSLKNLQKQQDAIESFENTAGKNLDQFLETAKAVVDSGSPLINKPLRSISGSVLGTQDQAAFNTARQVAVTEIAKVLNNPNGSAALSDSARHEVQDLIGPNATLGQIYKASQILRNDMKSRRDSGRDQIKAIQERIGGTGSTYPAKTATGIAPTHTLNGRGIGIDSKTNKWVFVDDGSAAQ